MQWRQEACCTVIDEDCRLCWGLAPSHAPYILRAPYFSAGDNAQFLPVLLRRESPNGPDLRPGHRTTVCIFRSPQAE